MTDLHARIESLRAFFAKKYSFPPTTLALPASFEKFVPDMPGMTDADRNLIKDIGLRSWINTARKCQLNGLYVVYNSPELRVGDRRRFVTEADLAAP